jgi:hypothetical protein
LQRKHGPAVQFASLLHETPQLSAHTFGPPPGLFVVHVVQVPM